MKGSEDLSMSVEVGASFEAGHVGKLGDMSHPEFQRQHDHRFHCRMFEVVLLS